MWNCCFVQRCLKWSYSTFKHPPFKSLLHSMCVYSVILSRVDYSNRLNTGFIWIPSSMGVQYLNGKVHDLADHSNTGRFGPWTGFSVRFSDHRSNTGPFDNQTQTYHSNNGLIWYSDGYSIFYSTVQNNHHFENTNFGDVFDQVCPKIQ